MTKRSKEDWWIEIQIGEWCQRGSGRNEVSELE